MSLLATDIIRRAEVVGGDPVDAVRELAEQLRLEAMAGVVFYCASTYDPDALAAALDDAFDCPVIGCTTAGEIGRRYQTDGIVAVSFSADRFRLHPRLIPSLDEFDGEDARALTDDLRKRLAFSGDLDRDAMFGMVLLDGLSIMEEKVTAHLHSCLGGVSLVGGSAGDSLEFRETRVYADGRFHTGAGVFALIESKLPFRTFKLQHFEASELDMVITEADPATRTVTEINGGPAAEEYAEILGLEIDVLNPQVFAQYPVMLQIGDEWYVRSIQKVNPDGSLTFYCAIDEGLPLTIARGVGFVNTLEAKIAELESEFGNIQCTLGWDCILRRLELMNTGKMERVESALSRLNFVGFSTFGEQFGALHVNQTLTGVVLGE